MKIINQTLWGACTLLMLAGSPAMHLSAQSLSSSTKWEWNKGTIVIQTPEREAGQEPVIGLTAPKMEVVRVGFVGLGMRGPGAVERFTYIPGTAIVALCDHEKERAEACQKYLRKACLPEAAVYSGAEGYKELCERTDIDLVYIAADWDHHFPIAEYAMQHGKHVAIEVPSAMNLEQCWKLIDLSEKNRKHCFILENCCYDWFEMNTLNMAQQGVFGEVIRAQEPISITSTTSGIITGRTEKKINWDGVCATTRKTAVTYMPHTAWARWHRHWIFTVATA